MVIISAKSGLLVRENGDRPESRVDGEILPPVLVLRGFEEDVPSCHACLGR